MKVVILAGGIGSRLGSIGELIPKPMIDIGGKPIIWHIMKIYAHYGYRDFIVALGYKANIIKDYFLKLHFYNSDFCVDTGSGEVTSFSESSDSWNVTLVDTGIDTLKGGRIKRLEKYLDDTNLLTYGDGVSNVVIPDVVKFHRSHRKLVTITGVRPPSMFGEIIEQDGKVISFEEKPQTGKGLINGGYMVFNKGLLDYLTPDKHCDFEFGALEKLASMGEVIVYKHPGFWECADTVRDVNHLNRLWETEKAEWKIWT